MPVSRSSLARTLLLGAAIAGCGSAPDGTAPGQSPATGEPTASASGARERDLQRVRAALEANHPDPFLGEAAAFDGRIDVLRARAGGLDDDAFMVELMRLLAGRVGDGHTGLIPFAQADAGLTAWPLALYAFDEGLYVVDARPPHEDAVGARVVAIGGRPVDDVAAAVAPLVSADNEWTVRARLPGYLVVPAVLRGLGLFDPAEAALTLEDRAGATLELTPDEIPIDDFRRWRGLFDPLVPPALPPDGDGPLTLRNRDEHFWSAPAGDALYVGYNQVQGETAGGETIFELAGRIREALADGEVRRVVVDVRHNPGGENGSYPPLLEVLRELATDRPGSVVVLIGRSTFSAAGNFITELAATPGVRFVGEPSGGAPNMYGDATLEQLPESGFIVHLATRRWEFAPGDDAAAIAPDVAVPVRWADYAAGGDPALDAALGLE
ncbi:MAG TPA: hypothetical protein VLA44_07260 [Clostridia bacterium]|nr:hypothetical protein [Clostridia bacterium]